LTIAQETTPRTWWEELGVPFRGKFADDAALRPDSPEEQRIQRLRRAVTPAPGSLYRLSSHRARIVTESYRQTEGQHPAIRRARAMDAIFRQIPIPMPSEQLLLGTSASDVGAVEINVEMMAWSQEAATFLSRHDNYDFSDDDKRLFADEIIPYWRGRARGDFALRELEANDPEALAYYRDAGAVIRGVGGPLVHTIQDYNTILCRGLDGVKADLRADLATIDGAAPAGVADLERRNHFRAMLIVADGMIAYAERCADLAEAAAGREPDPARAAELREMARVCRRVPRLPAAGWWEALQSLHFLRMSTALVEGGGSHCVGRFDQYMLPFLRRDIDSSALTRQRAQELLECLYVKWNEVPVYAAGRGGSSEGMRQNDKLTIGGVNADGLDATNELSFMCLEAHAHVHLNDPNISLRVHRDTPDDLLRRSLEVIRLGGGLPQIISDEAIIPSLMGNCGLSLEDARNYADIGCQENVSDPNVSPGHDTNGYTNTGWFNVVKPVELALWDGVNPINGQQVGPHTGDPRTFDTVGRFVEAVRAQYDHAARMNATVCSAVEYTFSRYYPCPFHNLMHCGPRRTGVDVTAGGCYYNWSGSLGVGLANAGDSMSAISHLIYETRTATWDELLTALSANWVGFEELRQRCVRAPKYGAADPRADEWSRLASRFYADAFAKCRSPKGGRLVVGLISMATFGQIGRLLGPTPDGRRRGEMVADSTSPSRYAPSLGPTAAHLSNARGIDTWRVPNGVTFNQRFSASAVQSERDLSRWADLVRTYVDAGGQSVQYTVVDRDMLVDAQKHPSAYRDLFVRVGGYSALFIELSRDIQDAVIARAEQSF
jgi:pyruvate formate-lyase/glycerol dehydratase family glycyl radical enzyme